MNHTTTSVEIPIRHGYGHAVLRGDLTLVDDAAGLVIFAHGSGSSRRSSRNRAVAKALVDAGLATLLMDLLTEQEELIDERTAALRFDIELLTDRVTTAIDWAAHQDSIARLPIGLFGASTGAAAALRAAAKRPERVAAVVSRGGRPDLAGNALPLVKAPTLLIVGGADDVVIGLNEEAKAELTCESELAIVPRATHLFEEPGALEAVARLAAQWFLRHLGAVPKAAVGAVVGAVVRTP
jgi:dienelactone hydrolase